MRRILRYAAILLIISIVCLGNFVPAQAATIASVSPTSGFVGNSVTVSGTSAGATDTVTIKYDNNTVATTTASGSSWSASFSVPASTAGQHNITATDSAGQSSASLFTVSPRITVSQPSTAVNLNGTGFAANESITITAGSSTYNATSDANGSWSYSISSIAAGSYSFSATDTDGNSASYNNFNVVAHPTIALGKTSGPVGTSVTINGAGFAANETGIKVTFGSNQVGTTNADSNGAWTLTFNVPAVAGGSQTINASGPTTTSVTGQSFNVTPVINLKPSSASPGATITVTGSGFADGENVSVTYDDINNVIASSTASTNGTWTTTFKVPPGAAGTHNIDAYGSSTSSASVPELTFKVGAGIIINKSSGSAGTSITVTGAGFGSNETGIVVTYDDDPNPVSAPITAKSDGSWTATFTIPAKPAGTYNISASGSETSSVSVPFTSTASVSLSPNMTSGAVGSSINLTGSGFVAGDTVTITLDNNSSNPLGTAKADSNGGWTATITIPASTAGSHTITVQGSTTAAINLNFSVTPSLSLDNSSGYVGASVNVSGSGFAANSTVTLTYDGNPINNVGTVKTDATGSFAKQISIPASDAGSHTIKVTDAQNNSSSTGYTIGAVTLSVPNPISPSDGSKVGLTGGATPDFKWSPVTDPNGGITYSLQVDTDPDFPHPLLVETGITVPHYTLNKTEALPSGTYYWRVRAIDAASNQSDWSQPIQLQSGIISAALLIVLIIIVVIVAIALVIYFLVLPMQRRRKAQEAARAPVQAPEIVIPEVVNAEYRAIDPEDTAKKQRALPWRLALPQAPAQPKGSKGGKTLSPEDQARLKVIIDFAKSLPLIEPGNNANWIVDLAENGSGEAASTSLYAKLLKGELQVRYEPAWMRHPTFMDLQTLLEGQPILQDLDSFVDSVNHSASEAILLLQDIYRDTTTEVNRDILENNGWGFVSGVYTDAISWFLGKYLKEPSERDYSIKPDGKTGEGNGLFGLSGEPNTPFAGILVQASDENEASQLRALHLKLRRNYRNNDRAREVVSSITQLGVQRDRLLNAFNQFNRLNA